MQVTATPATIAVSINHDNYTHGCIDKTGKFAISILNEATKPSLIGTFGFASTREIDKFSEVDYEIKEQMPVIKNTCGYLVCNVIDQFETATHTIFLGEVLDGDTYENVGDAMTYAYYHSELKGSSSKNAPTYVPPVVPEKTKENNETSNLEGEAKGKRYVCQVCGYEEYFVGPVPEDFVCPICRKGADKMIQIDK
jgi:flavin reductase (DIM6/NTAB) family NADH-FMN oxidoreductase RutF